MVETLRLPAVVTDRINWPDHGALARQLSCTTDTLRNKSGMKISFLGIVIASIFLTQWATAEEYKANPADPNVLGGDKLFSCISHSMVTCTRNRGCTPIHQNSNLQIQIDLDSNEVVVSGISFPVSVKALENYERKLLIIGRQNTRIQIQYLKSNRSLSATSSHWSEHGKQNIRFLSCHAIN